jgi:hypothetical protein
MAVSLGDLRYYLNEDIEPGKKATGVGTDFPPGACVQLDPASGLWILSDVDNTTWRHGVIPNLYPIPTESNAGIQVVTGSGAEIYVRLNGTAKPNQGILGDDGGKVKAVTGVGFASYIGKEGEGMGGLDDLATDAVDEAIICIKLGPGA